MEMIYSMYSYTFEYRSLRNPDALSFMNQDLMMLHDL